MNRISIRSDELVTLADALRHAYWNTKPGELTRWPQISSKAKEEWLRTARAALQAVPAAPPATTLQGAPCAAAGGAGVASTAVPWRAPHCAARQAADRTVCTRCRFAWDTNDPMPPSCLP